MISRIRGILLDVNEGTAVVEAGGLAYDILIPPFSSDLLLSLIGTEIVLFTYYYIMGGNVGNGMPTLIGFPSKTDKDFFERFITVSGIGPKAAIKALALSTPVVASAIEKEDIRTLKSLPGVGDRTAREIVAKLRGKVAQFAADDPGEIKAAASSASRLPLLPAYDEALDVLIQLGYRSGEAEKMLKDVVAQYPDLLKAEDMIQEVFKRGIQKA